MTSTTSSPGAFIATGVPNLDVVLGGGIPQGSVVFVVGAPGSGKTTLALQIAMHFGSGGGKVVLVSTLSTAASRLVRHMRGFTFWDERLLGSTITMTSLAPVLSASVDAVLNALVETVRAHDARLLIVDGFQTVSDLHSAAPELRAMVHQLAVQLAPLGCTTLLTSSLVPHTGQNTPPEFAICDGIVELSERDVGAQQVRSLRVWKMRGVRNLLGEHTLQIASEGITIYPRAEARITMERADVEPRQLSSGAPELDSMLGGGLPAGSVSVLAGAPGTGKTLLALQYLAEGVGRGEHGLFLGFRESARQLQEKARAFKLDLDSAVEGGGLKIVRRAPVELNVDQLTAELVALLEASPVQRLVIDTIGEFEQSIVDERRRSNVMASLLELLRARGVTALLTREIGQIVASELNFVQSPLELLAENLILLRYVELKHELIRVVSVLKMRDSAHDSSIRQYRIDAEGVRVLPPAETGEHRLRGIAKQESEQRAKQKPALAAEGNDKP